MKLTASPWSRLEATWQAVRKDRWSSARERPHRSEGDCGAEGCGYRFFISLRTPLERHFASVDGSNGSYTGSRDLSPLPG